VIDLTDLAAFDEDEEIVLACAQVCGINVGIGVPFDCVLPGHGGAVNGSMLWREPGSNHIVVLDSHFPGRGKAYILAKVFAYRHRGRMGNISPKQLGRWKLKLLHAAGLIEPEPVLLPPIPGADATLLKVVAGLRELVGLRRLRDENEERFPFSRRFAADWCQVEEMEAYEAIGRLRARGVLVHVADEPSGYGEPTPLYVLAEAPGG
jgi:hypothetical protein